MNNDMINKMIHIPGDFRTLGNISFHSLLKQSGYFQFREQIKESDIQEALGNNPECINEWMQWSEDKRCNSGWYFMKERRKYIVGYYSTNNNAIQRLKFSDINVACAAFIKRESEEIRAL